MKITKVSYGKTCNIGNYQSIRIEMESDVGLEEDHNDVLTYLKHCLGIAEEQVRTENKPINAR